MQVVIAEDPSRPERLEQPERPKRVGTAVHEVADRIERVLRGVEPEAAEKPLQLIAATLNITNEDPSSHRGEATPRSSVGGFRVSRRMPRKTDNRVSMPIALSVNLNKVALLRNSRGGSNPSPRVAAETCLAAGASGITLHWREDNRHTKESDVRDLRALCAERAVECNLEGDSREELVALAFGTDQAVAAA